MKKELECKLSDIQRDDDIGAHCPKHGPGPNKVYVIQFDDGDADIFCWCGNLLAILRPDGFYVRDEVLLED